MSKFCIQLNDISLPDAIAAVVEAWYDAQNTEGGLPQGPLTYEPGERIEIRDTTVLYESWHSGFVFYKAMSKKVGICAADKWNFEQKTPEYLLNGGQSGSIFTDRESGCLMKMPNNIRKCHPNFGDLRCPANNQSSNTSA
jgi:hypothetical protein